MKEELTSKQIAWVNFQLAEEFITSFLANNPSQEAIQHFADFIATFETQFLTKA